MVLAALRRRQAARGSGLRRAAASKACVARRVMDVVPLGVLPPMLRSPPARRSISTGTGFTGRSEFLRNTAGLSLRAVCPCPTIRAVVRFCCTVVRSCWEPRPRWRSAHRHVGEVLLRIGGTGMALAAMRQIGDASRRCTRTATVKVLPSLGTGGGLAAVAAGAIDLALAARALNDAELAKGLAALRLRPDADRVRHPSGRRRPRRSRWRRLRQSWRAACSLAGRNADPADPAGTLGRRLDDAADVSPEMAAAVRYRAGTARSADGGDRPGQRRRAGTTAGSFGAMSIGQLRAEAPRCHARSCWMATPPTRRGARRRTLPAVAHPVCRLARASRRAEVARFLAFLRASQASELLMRLGHIPLAGSGA